MIAAQHLKDLRLKHNYTQEYLALELNMSQKSYSNLENGSKKITLEMVTAIAQCYSIDPIELVSELVSVSSEFIDKIKKEEPNKTEMEIHHGVNDSLQMELIRTLQMRIEDLTKIIKMKEDKIMSLED